MQVQPLEPGHLDAVAQIEAASYRGLSEPPETLHNKRTLFPRGALGCFEGDTLLGYVLCLPWRRDTVVPLGKEVAALPPAPDTLYLHDLAVAPEARGLGVARVLFDAVLALAHELSLPTVSLVAVQGSDPFWSRLGFRPMERFEYAPGVPAVRMHRKL